MITRDYLMEEAERLTKLIAAVVFQKQLTQETVGEEYVISHDEILLGDLRRMVAAGQINHAENLLFERLQADLSAHNLTVASTFYGELSELEDNQLRLAGFLREEIMEGILAVEEMAKHAKSLD